MQLTSKSKYKYLEGRPSKETISAIELPSQNMEGDGIACSGSWVAFPWKVGGGGKVVVKRADQFGKCHSTDPSLNGHEGEILDLAFSPFNDFLLASGSLDATIRLWNLPVQGILTESIGESLTVLAGHSNKVQLMKWNPLANNILASGSAKGEVLVWDVTKEDELYSFPVLNQNITAIDWNLKGQLLALAHRDKKFRLGDPRSAQYTAEFDAHQSSQPSKIVWTGDCELVSVGNSKMNEHEICGYDSRKLDEPVFHKVLGQGKRSNALYFVPDNNILFTVGRGESGIHFYEKVKEEPYLEKLMGWSSQTPQIGFTLLPRRLVDEKQCVIAKAARLSTSHLEYVSFLVPRKSATLQKDLFPSCPSYLPTYSAQQWVEGVTKEPLTMKWGKEGFQRIAYPQEGSVSEEVKASAKFSEESKSVIADLKVDLEAKDKEIFDLRAEVSEDKVEIDQLKEQIKGLQVQIAELQLENQQLKAQGQVEGNQEFPVEQQLNPPVDPEAQPIHPPEEVAAQQNVEVYQEAQGYPAGDFQQQGQFEAGANAYVGADVQDPY